MGYTHLTDIQTYIPPSVFFVTAGTISQEFNNNVPMLRRAGADALFDLHIPIPGLPSSLAGTQGAKITRIEVHYRVQVSPLDAISAVTLSRVRFRIPGQIPQADLIDFSWVSDHDTSDKRRALAHHQMVLDIDEPEFIQPHQSYWLNMICDGSTNGIMDMHGAVVHYTLRL